MTWEEFHIDECVRELNALLHERVYTLRIYISRKGYKQIRIYRYGIMVARGKIYCKNYIEKRLEEEYERLERNDE